MRAVRLSVLVVLSVVIVLPSSASAPLAAAEPDARYGVILLAGAPGAPSQELALTTLGLRTYIDYTIAPGPIGMDKVLYVPITAGVPRDTPEEAQDVARQRPGSAWYLGGEPNVPTQGNTAPDVYADFFHTYATAIRAADPTARILSASVLNWEFTCTLCGGYTPGREWVEAFRAAYRVRYGAEPPVDVWAIDTYDLDWENLPLANAARVTDQIAGLRAYLDAIPEQRGKPIWLTEFGIVFGHDDFELSTENDQTVLTPVGPYREDLEAQYLNAVLDWLEANSASMNVQRWFLFATWPPAEATYHGTRLFTSGPELTAAGRLYMRRAGGTSACTYHLGFAALHGLIPAIVGPCVADETHNPLNADGLQETANGLLVWRKADNWTAFTDGTTTWINGPCGLQSRPNDQRFPWESGGSCDDS